MDTPVSVGIRPDLPESLQETDVDELAKTRSSSLPTPIGPFRLLERLAESERSTVFRAADPNDPTRQVALKVIHSSLEREGIKSFRNEAHQLERLKHPNIVTLLGTGVRGDQAYWAMEFLDGVPLSAYNGRPFTETVPLFIQVCEGMQYMASHSVIHLNLTPGNILVCKGLEGPIIKILDFGFFDCLARTGQVSFSLYFASPEQVFGGKVDGLSDIYALGVIFYLVLSGKLPISPDHWSSSAGKHRPARPGPVVAPPNNPPLPVVLVELIQRMLEEKPELRPQSYNEIIDILKESLGEGPSQPRPGSLQKRANPTIVGGRPPAEGDAGSNVPSGIDRLLRQAARDPKLRADLIERRGAAAAGAGITLTSEEAALLDAVPADQLALLLDKMPQERDDIEPGPTPYPAPTGIPAVMEWRLRDDRRLLFWRCVLIGIGGLVALLLWWLL